MILDGVTNLILFIVKKKPRGIFPRTHIYPHFDASLTILTSNGTSEVEKLQPEYL